jgi:hemerythrin-like domain-containing protein
MPIIIETLREEHRNITKLLDVLEREIELAAVASDPDWDVLNGIANYFCEYPDRCHHPKEDTIFERLQAKFPEEARSIGDLLREHRDVRLRVQRFRGHIQSIFLEDVLPREELIGSARAFIDAERRHMMKEQNIFFPAAEKLLVEEDWKWIESQLQNELDPLFQESVEHEFATVRERLLAWERERKGS